MDGKFTNSVRDEMISGAKMMEDVFCNQKIRARVKDMERAPDKTTYVLEVSPGAQVEKSYDLIKKISESFRQDGVRLILTQDSRQITVEVPR